MPDMRCEFLKVCVAATPNMGDMEALRGHGDKSGNAPGKKTAIEE
jgi:hypothetical protein